MPCSKYPYQATVKVMATRLNRLTEENNTMANNGRLLGILGTSGEFGNLMVIPLYYTGSSFVGYEHCHLAKSS